MEQLSCPHCGFSKEIARERLPKKPARVTCPQCRVPFRYAPPSRGPDRDTFSVTIVCPGCGKSKIVSREAIPGAGRQVNCADCRTDFTIFRDGRSEPVEEKEQSEELFDPRSLTREIETSREAPDPAPTRAQESPASAVLTGVGDLFRESWRIFMERAGTLIPLYLLAMVVGAGPFFILFLAGFFMLQSQGSIAAMVVAGALGAVVATIGASWATVAMLCAIADPGLGIRAALASGWQRVWSFIWVYLLVSFMVAGGYALLLIPGVVFSVWFYFGHYVVAIEPERGMAALLKSKNYVRGHFWPVLGRGAALVAAFMVITLLLGLIPAGQLLATLLMPFMFIYFFLIYRDLKALKNSEDVTPAAGEKTMWLSVGTLGNVLLLLALVLPLWSLYTENSQRIRAMLGSANLAFETPSPPPYLPPAASPQREKLAAQGIAPVSLWADDYQELLQKAQPPGDDPSAVPVGPATLRIGEFWADAAQPHLWLKLTVDELPNLELDGRNFTRLRIERVVTAAGADVYDRASGFETPFFEQVSLSHSEHPQPHFQGIRNVYLKAGTGSGDIVRIEGTLTLTLPLGVEVHHLDPSMIGQRVLVAEKHVYLKELEGSEVLLEYHGNFDHYLTAVAFNRDGEQLADAGSSWSTAGEVTTLQKGFAGEIASLMVVVASDQLQRDYPFALQTP